MKKVSSLYVHFFISLFATLIFCVIANYTLDPYMTSLLHIHKNAVCLTHSVPDLLLWWVSLSSLTAWISYFLFLTKRSTLGQFCYYYGILIPIAFVLKTGLKFIFGRPNPRDCIQGNADYGYHWFAWGSHYSAFPSGHMLIFTVMVLLINNFYPRLRLLGYSLLVLLAIALIITGYHYISDIVAAVFVGYWLVRLMMLRKRT